MHLKGYLLKYHVTEQCDFDAFLCSQLNPLNKRTPTYAAGCASNQYNEDCRYKVCLHKSLIHFSFSWECF